MPIKLGCNPVARLMSDQARADCHVDWIADSGRYPYTWPGNIIIDNPVLSFYMNRSEAGFNLQTAAKVKRHVANCRAKTCPRFEMAHLARLFRSSVSFDVFDMIVLTLS